MARFMLVGFVCCRVLRLVLAAMPGCNGCMPVVAGTLPAPRGIMYITAVFANQHTAGQSLWHDLLVSRLCIC
jgi:hypothetical protein